MTARLPQRRRDDDYLATLRCETAAVLYHAMKRALDDGELDRSERAEINQLLDQLEAATVALRRAVNARPAPEPKPVARVLCGWW